MGTSLAAAQARVSITLGMFWRGGVSQELLLAALGQLQATAAHMLGQTCASLLIVVRCLWRGHTTTVPMLASCRDPPTTELGSHLLYLLSSLPNSALQCGAGVEIKSSPFRASCTRCLRCGLGSAEGGQELHCHRQGWAQG